MAHATFIESGEIVTVCPSIPITGEEIIPEEIDLVGSEQIPLPELKCNMDDDSNDILRSLFSVLLVNHLLSSNEELGINSSNYRNGMFF